MTPKCGRVVRRHAAAVLLAVGCVVTLAPPASAGASSAPGSVPSIDPTGAGAVGLAPPPVTLPSQPVAVPPVTVPPVTVPPVTVPPVTVPSVTLPPMTVPQVPIGALPPAIGQITGALPGAGGTGSAPAPPDGGGPDPSGRGPRTGGTGSSDPTPTGSGRVQGGPTGADLVDSRASRGSTGSPSASGAATAADLVGPSGSGDQIEDAVRQDARRFGWPLVLGLAVVAFLALQGRVERHERKLADAPLDQGERLRFR